MVKGRALTELRTVSSGGFLTAYKKKEVEFLTSDGKKLREIFCN